MVEDSRNSHRVLHILTIVGEYIKGSVNEGILHLLDNDPDLALSLIGRFVQLLWYIMRTILMIKYRNSMPLRMLNPARFYKN